MHSNNHQKLSAVVLASLMAVAANAQNDGANAKSANPKEESDRNVMLNAASANGPRELKLFSNNGEVYLSANVVGEARALRKQTLPVGDIAVDNATPFIKRHLFADSDGAFEVEAEVAPGNADVVGLSLFKDREERTLIYLDLKRRRIVMDRAESGLVDFGKLAERHDIEKRAEAAGEMMGRLSQDLAVDYRNDFALGTWAPLSLCGSDNVIGNSRWTEDGASAATVASSKTYHLDIFVDKCSVELFVDGGRIAMTNLVFPTVPYNHMKVYAEGGKAKVRNLTLHKLAL